MRVNLRNSGQMHKQGPSSQGYHKNRFLAVPGRNVTYLSNQRLTALPRQLNQRLTHAGRGTSHGLGSRAYNMNSNLPESNIVLYQTEDGRTRVQCRFQDQTVWLSRALISELFQVTVPTVNEHLKGIFAEGELETAATIRKFRIVRKKGSRHVEREIEHNNFSAIMNSRIGHPSKPSTSPYYKNVSPRICRSIRRLCKSLGVRFSLSVISGYCGNWDIGWVSQKVSQKVCHQKCTRIEDDLVLRV